MSEDETTKAPPSAVGETAFSLVATLTITMPDGTIYHQQPVVIEPAEDKSED